MVSFNVSIFGVSISIVGSVAKNLITRSVSQVCVYRGKGGLRLNTPVTNRLIRACCERVLYPGICTMLASAERALHMLLYLLPFSNISVRKIRMLLIVCV